MRYTVSGNLRSETSLIQTIGRAARNVDGEVLMYVDDMTDSVRNAVDITNKRRKLQMAYNEKYNITPQSTSRTLKDKKHSAKRTPSRDDLKGMPKDELKLLIKDLETEMKEGRKQRL